uniref:Putative secreted protein n=1 Tax=Amblyomma americanum TaxID=6943 RepID=A0A0C9RVN6_AMBAM
MNVVGLMVFGCIFLVFIPPLRGCSCCASCATPNCVRKTPDLRGSSTTFYLPEDNVCKEIIFHGVCKGNRYRSIEECKRCCTSYLTK